MTGGKAVRPVTSSAVLAHLLASLAGTFDGDEPVDELTHALQCAQAACNLGARPALVAAALLHDVGRSPLVTAVHPLLGHERAGAAYLRPLLGDEVAWLVGQHVVAKAWLVEHEPGYAERLSSQSAASYVHQVGHVGDAPVAHPLWPDAVLLRRLDDEAKDPDAPRPDLSGVLSIVAPQVSPAAGNVSSRCAPAVEEGSDRLPTIATRGPDARAERPTRAARDLEV